MSSLKNVAVRMPLLFIVDSILKGSFLDFTHLSTVGLDIEEVSPAHDSNFTEEDGDTFEEASDFSLHSIVYDACQHFIWVLIQIAVLAASLIVLFSPIETVKKFFRCLGGALTLFLALKFDMVAYSANINLSLIGASHLLACIVVPVVLVTLFDYLCTRDVVEQCFIINPELRGMTAKFVSRCFTGHMFLKVLVSKDSMIFSIVVGFAWLLLLPAIWTQTYQCLWMGQALQQQVVTSFAYAKRQLQEVGFEMFCMNVMEDFNLSSLFRIFFFLRLGYHVMVSKTISEFQIMDNSDSTDFSNFINSLILEMLHEMCGTLLSIVSLASLVCIVSGWSMRLMYRLMGAPEGEEETVQPAISGFMFVLLAMQTGMTSVTAYYRLQLLLQNCILLVAANQHFVQGVAADLVLKASTEDVPLTKHVRPMIPYFVIFAFPFMVMRLWDYPFRLSWLLAISAFTVELLIKSVTTLILYVLNIVHSRTNYLQENLDDILFYIKGGCGCLEFICGIFLFINCAYIFIFESGGLIRLAMMVIHFYSNIYRTALKGWASFKLYRSAWMKVSKLKLASQEELDANDDICPICYQELKEAVIIQCAHVFHKACLLKWLYIQEKCPLCHTTL